MLLLCAVGGSHEAQGPSVGSSSVVVVVAVQRSYCLGDVMARVGDGKLTGMSAAAGEAVVGVAESG